MLLVISLAASVLANALEPNDYITSKNPYCNAGFLTDSTNVDYAQVVGVQVARHGARAPNFGIPSDEHRTFDCTLANTNKKTAMTVFKEINDSPHVPPHWNVSNSVERDIKGDWTGIEPCKPQQLTDFGWSQLFNIGKHFKNVYPHITTPDKLYVRSTSKDRAKDSASALLKGMIGDEEFLVHVLPQSIETLEFPSKLNCPAYHALDKKIRKENVEFQEFHAAIKDDRLSLDNLTKTSSSSSPFLGNQFDILVARSCIDQPIATTQEFAQFAQKFQSYVDVETRFNYRDLASNEIRRFLMGPFLGEVVSNFDAIKGDGKKFFYYSAHDNTIHTLLGILEATNEQMKWAPYASTVVTELLKQDDEYFVRVLFNGQVLQVNKDKVGCDLARCPLKKFLGHISKFSVSPEEFENYEAECIKQ